MKDSNRWSLFGQLIGAALFGAFVTFLATTVSDYFKEIDEEKETAKIIYLDVQNNLMKLQKILDELPLEEVLHGGWEVEPKWAKSNIYETMFDTRVFETYMRKVPLFHPEESARVLEFYSDLSSANDLIGILTRGVTYGEINDIWLTSLYDRVYKCYGNGNRIIAAFEKRYGIKPSEQVKKEMNDVEKKILTRNPDLKKKLFIQNQEETSKGVRMLEFGTIFTGIIAIFAAIAGIAAWASVRATKLSMEGGLLSTYMQQYSSKEMISALRTLRDWQEKYGEGFEEKWGQYLFNREAPDHKAAYEVDFARRYVKYYYLTALQLYESKYVKKRFIRNVTRFDGIEILYDVIQLLEPILNPDWEKAKFDKLREIRPPKLDKKIPGISAPPRNY